MYYVLCKNNEYLVVDKSLNIVSRFYTFEEAREMSMYLNYQEISYNSFKAYANVFLGSDFIGTNGYNLNCFENSNQNFIYNNQFSKPLPINNSLMEKFNNINQSNQNMNFLNDVKNINKEENFNIGRVLNDNNFVEQKPVAKKIIDNNFDYNFENNITRNSVDKNIKVKSNYVDRELNKKVEENQNLETEKNVGIEDFNFDDETLSFVFNEKSLNDEEISEYEDVEEDEEYKDEDFTISTSEIASFIKKIKK